MIWGGTRKEKTYFLRVMLLKKFTGLDLSFFPVNFWIRYLNTISIILTDNF
jgi:hypothetical protein